VLEVTCLHVWVQAQRDALIAPREVPEPALNIDEERLLPRVAVECLRQRHIDDEGVPMRVPADNELREWSATLFSSTTAEVAPLFASPAQVLRLQHQIAVAVADTLKFHGPVALRCICPVTAMRLGKLG
jgi:hypothetical protein